MRAIVCDLCGKTVLLEEDDRGYVKATGFHRLICDSFEDGKTKLEICDECADKLIEAVRANANRTD